MKLSSPLVHSQAARSDSIPIVQGVLVGEREEVDAVPLIGVDAATTLGPANAFSVVQRPSFSEALCPACERSNIYDIYDGISGRVRNSFAPRTLPTRASMEL